MKAFDEERNKKDIELEEKNNQCGSSAVEPEEYDSYRTQLIEQKQIVINMLETLKVFLRRKKKFFVIPNFSDETPDSFENVL